jgi:hypothetical protein
VRIVRWFIEDRWGRRAKPDSTLGQLLAISEKLDLNGPAKSIESIEPDDARHLLHASAALARLAWAIRALHGNDAIDCVDGSFIDDEVMGEDTKQPDAERRLPGGIGHGHAAQHEVARRVQQHRGRAWPDQARRSAAPPKAGSAVAGSLDGARVVDVGSAARQRRHGPSRL